MSALASPAFWIAITGVIGAITGLVTALRASNKADAAVSTAATNEQKINEHIRTHP
jgi:hypothetical protein